ncbi:MAG: hypothetical protein F9K13_03960 [Candidatus Methylomirabilis oxygeniifera]|nr:MAG: hypothetical protein F9K13_03960 [Candidatus Methylomirabilis oxyfera]
MATGDIQGAVEAIVVDPVRGHAQQILTRGLGIPGVGDLQFRRWGAESGNGEEAGHDGPRDRFPAFGHLGVTPGGQAEPVPQEQRQIHIAEVSQPLDADTRKIDSRPCRRLCYLFKETAVGASL